MDKGTILVVEDEPNIADLVDLYLSRDGFRVVKKATGEDGLAAIRDQQPRLVVARRRPPGRRRARGVPWPLPRSPPRSSGRRGRSWWTAAATISTAAGER